jgi:hypothetical protein
MPIQEVGEIIGKPAGSYRQEGEGALWICVHEEGAGPRSTPSLQGDDAGDMVVRDRGELVAGGRHWTDDDTSIEVLVDDDGRVTFRRPSANDRRSNSWLGALRDRVRNEFR